MLRHSVVALVLALAAVLAGGADDTQPLPKGLIDYVRSAKSAGLTDSDIQKNAAEVGWRPADIAKALAGPASLENAAPKASAAPEPARPPSTPEVALPAVDHPASVKPAPPGQRPVSGVAGHGVDDDFLIGAGDVVQISVWKEPDASVASTVVRPDGKITMPLVKDVSLVGLTPRQAEHHIAQLLSKFINDADVTVVVAEINSKKVYVLGAVKKEGPLPYTYRMTIMQALSEAGGLTDYAKRKKIYVLRKENGRDFRLPFDYDAVLRGERMELNITLLAGDTLVVPH